jgi:uncharacterized protein
VSKGAGTARSATGQLPSYQEALRDALLSRDPPEASFVALGANPERWKVYRRMVRSRFAENIEHGFERLRGAVGEDRFREMIWQFLAESPPRSHYLRDVPGEFLRFFEQNYDRLARAFGLPVHALDLARYEWAELETSYSDEEVAAETIGPLAMDRVPALSPAHRLIDVAYPVHRTEEGAHAHAIHAAPFSLCLYRDPKTHEVAVLELTPVTAIMLSSMESRTSTLTDIVRNAADAVGATLDVAFVDALSTVLADFVERGLLLGSLVT